MDITIDRRIIGLGHPVYFIADIAANHDGSLERAARLIQLARESGADAAKFQHFRASQIVSQKGFDRLGNALSHQASWSRPVAEVYRAAEVPEEWTPILKAECDRVGITFFSSPYDSDAVDALDPFVPAFKIGSGDIDWLEQLQHIAAKGKPVLLATGAATMEEVALAVAAIQTRNQQLVLLQCNTNYTASDGNFDHLHLNVLKSYAERWPDLVLGLSDHTHGPAAVLGAVALGARVIERHFTDDNEREGPDHRFALTPAAWRSMVEETRRLERALGSPDKFVAGNERDTVIVQRRCLRARHRLEAGTPVGRRDFDVLRPASPGTIGPSEIAKIVGRILTRDLSAGDELRWADVAE